MIIQSRQNPLVKELASLTEKKGRRRTGTCLVEGRKMVREAVAHGWDVVRLVLRRDYLCGRYGIPAVALGTGVL